jgi:phosphoribosyl-AMP cyclohydrolase / phosphoribosyl-ATP pyrophosphohydrolase
LKPEKQSQKMEINFKKNGGLVPAIIQDAETKNVLMMAWMNPEAYEKTLETGKVTFYSRSRKKLWTKGEESGNYMEMISIQTDCDNDTLLVKVKPAGPACHTGTGTCWGEENKHGYGFLSTLEEIIRDRKENPSEKSYTSSLFRKGINKIAQKVGEEAVELIIEAKDRNPELFANEAADLIFHFLVLIREKNIDFHNIISVLKKRHS